jgi:hypothetical protein
MAENSQDFTQDSSEQGGISPKVSMAHRQLLATAEAKGLSRDRVRELLWLINAPPVLDELGDVLVSLAEVLAGAEAQWPGTLELQQIEWIPELIRDLLLKVPIRIRESPDSEVQDASEGLLTRNALFGSLRKSPKWTRELLARYRLLQAHYFFAHSAWLIRNENRPPTPTSIEAYETYGGKDRWPALTFDPYDASLCIRDMTEEKAFNWATEYLNKLPVTLNPRQFPPHSAVRMLSRVQGYSVQKKVNYVSDYLGHIYGMKGGRAGRGSSPGPRYHSEIGDPDDPWLNFGYLSDWDTESQFGLEVPLLVLPSILPDMATPADTGPFTGPGGSGDSDEEAEADDQVPSDEECDEDESETFGGSLDVDEPDYDKSPASFTGRITGAIHQVIRQQKMFPFGIERLSPGELIEFGNHGSWLLQGLSEHLQYPARTHSGIYLGDKKFGLTPIEEAAARMFLMTMMWTGSDPPRAASILVATSEQHLQDAPFGLVIPDRYLVRPPTLRIRIPFPRYKLEQPPAPGFDCDRTQYVYLDARWLAYRVVAYHRMRRMRGDLFKLFPGPMEQYKASAEKMLKVWDPSGRLTIHKITWALFGRVMQETGNDAVAATMITGLKHRLSRTAMFYACRELSVIQKTYQTTISAFIYDLDKWQFEVSKLDVTGDHECDGRRIQPPKYEPTAPDAHFLGSRLCPHPRRFRLAVLDLLGDLKKKPYRSSPNNTWLEYHNLYTFYTIWMFALATGVRKMITPYLSPSAVSPLNHVALLRDKDGDSGLKAKLVWIPALVLKQMENYDAHLSYVRERFEIAEDNLPCFFLTGAGRVRPVRPSSLFPYVSKYLPGFPVEIHRRFIFNLLLDFGCPPEVTRLWMGHAVAGDEWWSEHATISHQQYRKELEKYLVPILEYLELNPIEGASPSPRVRREGTFGA